MHGHRFSLKAAVPRFILRSGFQTPHFRALSSAFPGTATGKRVLDSDGSPKVCFISGAASGIGRASAIRLASEGGIVVVADLPLQEAAGRKVVEECNAENPKGKAMFVTLDVTVESQWEAAMKAVEKQYGRLDVICNNAGVYFNEGFITEESLETFKNVQDVNVNGVFLGTKHAIPLMNKTKATHLRSIINISSVAGLIGGGGPIASYFTSKGAVRLLTKATALQCTANKYPIRVNSVHPGVIITPLWDRGFVPGASGTDSSKAMSVAFGGATLEELEKAVAPMTPMGRNGTAEDVAEMVTFLASNESSFSTGSEFVCDGGLVAQ